MTSIRVRLLSIVAALLFLVGCTFQLVYPRLPFLVGWRVDRYLHLDEKQEDWLDSRLQVHLAEHRQHSLPEYVRFVQSLKQRLANPDLSENDIRDFEQGFKTLSQILLRQVEEDGVLLLSQLSDEQVQSFLEKMREERDEQNSERGNLSEAERLAERFESVQETIENWVGSLGDEQRQLLHDYVAGWPELDRVSEPTRQRWEVLMEHTLQQRQDTDALRAALQKMFLQPESLRDPAYQQALDELAARRRTFYVALQHSLSTKQQQHLQETLSEWEDDFVALQSRR